MKKTCLLLAIVLLTPAVLAGASQAPVEMIDQELIPARHIKELAMSYHVVYTTGPGPVTPTPVDPDPGLRAGPISAGSRDAGMGLGSAIVSPRGGGAMYSPREQAGRDIDRLIRKLD